MKNGWRLWIGVAVSALAIWLVARRVDWPSFVAALNGVRPGWLAAGAAFSLGNYAASGLRWRQVIWSEVPLDRRDAVEIVMIANLANVVAPSRAGDLVRAVLVARRGSVPVARILGAVVVERYADVTMLLALALGLSAVVQFPPVVRVGVLAFAAAAAVSLAVVFVAVDRLAGLVHRIVSVVWTSMADRASGLVENVMTGIRRTGGGRPFAQTLMTSIAVWALAGGALFCYLRAFGFAVPWYAGAFVLLVVNLGGMIPSSPGSIGVYHYLSVLALSVWVADSSAALGFAVVAHALGLATTAVAGVASLALQHQSLLGVEHMVELAQQETIAP